MGAAATGDAHLLRKERDAARAESERLGVELDTLREKLLVHEKIKSPPAMQVRRHRLLSDPLKGCYTTDDDAMACFL